MLIVANHFKATVTSLDKVYRAIVIVAPKTTFADSDCPPVDFDIFKLLTQRSISAVVVPRTIDRSCSIEWRIRLT
jgi:hypothetical protein